MGLGPGGLGGISVAALEILMQAPKVLLRTRRHPVVEPLEARGMRAESFDSLCESSSSFDAFHAEIARAVLEEARAGDVAYAVPGSPTLGERTVALIREGCAAQGIPLSLVPSVNAADAVLALLRQSVDVAIEVRHAPDMDRLRPEGIVPVLVYGLQDAAAASEVKRALMDVYSDEHPVIVVRSAGAPGFEAQEEIPLYRLDRAAIDHLTSLYVPPLPQRPSSSFERLVEVMDALRAPGGCPWDREQTHESLRKYLTEETYEFFDALEESDDERMADELGDLLLQIVFHARIAREEGRFDIRDAIRSIVEKLVRRHPHVFGQVEAADAHEVLANWERIKATERLTQDRTSLLDRVPRSMPPLQRAFELTRRAASVGFDWENAAAVLDKLDEEARETRQALLVGDIGRIRDEIGDIFFVLTNLARKAAVDPEEALAAANRRFSERFRHIERRAAAQGRPLAVMSLAEMDALWNEAKAQKAPQADAFHKEG